MLGKECLMNVFSLLRAILPLLLVMVISIPQVLGDVTASHSTNQVADKNSKYYLLLEYSDLYSNQPYQAEIKEIGRLGQAQNLVGLAHLADNIEQTWGRQSDTQVYFALMDELTNVLRSHTFRPNTFQEQYLLTQKYVLATLAHRKVPLDVTARLLPRLIPEEELKLSKRPFDTVNWVQLRNARAPLWLQTRQRLKQLIVANYDLTSPILINNVTDTEELTNPTRAAARRKALKENNKKIQGRNDQMFVRFQDSLLSPTAESEIVTYYSQSPYDPQELKRLLDTYVGDTSTKQQILDQVAKNIAASQK